MVKIPKKYWPLCIYLALALTTLAVFWQLHNYDFVHYDDNKYITENENVKAGLTTDSITWAFTTGHAVNWHPLTWLSHMLDCQLFGTNPGWHHLTNLLLHITNTLLLFAVLKRMTGALWQSAFVAAAFALHPLHVESVAWISERKDVLSTLFWMLTMAAYQRYVRRPGTSRYLLTLLVFAMGLMAKPMLVTLPFVLLLLDYWPLGRFGLGQAVRDTNRPNLQTTDAYPQRKPFIRLAWEKVPFFILSAISSIVTFLVQRSGGAVTITGILPLKIRIINAFISYLGYIVKCFWPSRLAVYYPHPGEKLSMWHAAVAALLLAISILVICLAQKHKYLPVGWLWYLGTLVPVIGLVQVGAQAMADRYTYIPLIGLFIIIAWGLPELLAKWRYRKIALGASMLMVLLVLSICTWFQVGHWRNSITLFEHALDVTSENWMVHNNLGVVFNRCNEIDKAIEHCAEAVRIEPDYAEGHYNLGIALFRKGKVNNAIISWSETVRLDPAHHKAHNNLGAAFSQLGKVEQAIEHWREAVRLNPNDALARRNLESALSRQRKID